MSQPITEDEIDQAIFSYCDLARKSDVPKAFQRRPSLYYEALDGLQASPRKNRQRKRLGRFLINRYRKDQAIQGMVDWDKFKEWLKEHIAEINFLRLIVSILMLIILL